jgi:hypothetical protein
MNLSSLLEYTNFLINWADGGGYKVHLGSVAGVSIYLIKAELSLHKHIVKAILPASMSLTF